MKKYLHLIVLQFIASSAMAFEAHEWGTFTSLVGSDGITQNGMYHEDEKLPDFAHGFGVVQSDILPDPFPNCPVFTKSCFSMPVLQNNFVTQKMETPVIYFYGKGGEKITVDVDFPEGIITETYPAPIFSSPKPSDNLVMSKGTARFEVDLLPRFNLEKMPYVEPGNIYGYARDTQSLMVKTNNEVEKFIFYRGLGRFQPDFKILSSPSTLSLIGLESRMPKRAFLVHVKPGEEANMVPIIGPGSKFIPESIGFGTDHYQISTAVIDSLKEGRLDGSISGSKMDLALVDALIDSGLYMDEAFAMVNTWKNGYFKTPGLRILYIVPRGKVNRTLPVKMSPAPEEFERAFVARIEVMLFSEERQIVHQIIKEQLNFDITSLGRFAESRLRRAREVYIKGAPIYSHAIPEFKYGYEEIFDALIEKSMMTNTSPVIVQ